MELPADVVGWVSAHFKETEGDTALAKLRSAEIHTGEPALPLLLRCPPINSRGDLKLLDPRIRESGNAFFEISFD